MDENATSSSRAGAIPVHSELRQPRTSSSSAISRSSRSRSFTRFPQLRLQRVAVDSVVVAAQLVDEVLDLRDCLPRNNPQRGRLAPATVLLVGVRARKADVRCRDRARMLERLSLPLPAKDLEDHATNARSAKPSAL